ncbi:hypothetical protein DFH28DRAFT_914129 [Melampsora americana]|nr:hypothetical protein DFH28DRAFT_914129 [Melampsora americana]
MVNNGLAVRNTSENNEVSLLRRFQGEMPFDVGRCDDVCKDCGALHWKLERPRKTKNSKTSTFSTCCQRGAVKLPSDHFENDLTPEFLQRLLTDQDKDFRKDIRRYNNALSFASTAAKQDKTVAGNKGSWTYKIAGRLTHRIGSLLPEPGAPRKFAQMFMFGDYGDGDGLARSAFVGGDLDITLLNRFQTFMYAFNPFAKMYKSAEALSKELPIKTIKIRSMPIGSRDANRYNFPTCEQVAVVIEGDGVIGSQDRDIILRRVGGKLRRISELNTNYFSLRYPIFFMFGSHGWDEYYRNMESRREYMACYF